MAETDIDKSHLPRVYDVCQCFSVLEDGALAHSIQEQEIEQFYSTNIQKNQAVQNDVRLARRLQEEEEQRMNLRQDLRQLEEEDCRYAQRIQEELQRCAEEARRREKEDEEIAKQLQEEEEMEMRRQRAAAGDNDGVSPLCDGLGIWEQVLQDAELARRLQEEEDMLPHREQFPQSSGSEVDFIAAQVAQDEEIAHYMQRHQRRVENRPQDLEIQTRPAEPRDEGNTTTRKALQMLRERLNSDGLHSPVEEEDYTIENYLASPSCTALRNQHIHNIAEELDPTFKARKRESQSSTSPPSAGLCLAPRNPHSIFYDYLPEPTFIPPTKRQSDKAGRHKAKDKKENCKQQ
ncbi:coiled-coil domain-containing protein 50-like isoform X1 [Sinocyclocheilus grahami]|uniref:coiled-coil domain-containing protein 50-like isoform X1 n=1 Tax=Sinocyclocheilus grahami TaxID=75366 RepID=UPI0007AC5390|nr:PREDICTED: coiled-coil domain-containing protein 50-like isoform X1 [Sinocyclocheilus grahami]XP_016123798.1 PREDICTED: coiled-coil domain-containing protein 50-like isoform X1 [Sinocyclocheilus grahami]